MKIIIHSNGNPFTLKGGYAEQIRYLFRMFHEEGHDVYFFNTGMEQTGQILNIFLIK